MLDRTATKFSHVKPGDTQFVSGGLRDFFLYRDLGIADATNGKVIAHLVKANMAPETGTGWHRHEADFQIVIMVKGWARFMYEDKETNTNTTRTRHGESLCLQVFGIGIRLFGFLLPAPTPCGCAEERRFRRIRDRVV